MMQIKNNNDIIVSEQKLSVTGWRMINNEDSKYTGRKIAIFTDAHGLLEPTKAALEDMANKGINEIYSLGDNIGVGPNPSEVLDLLREYGVKSIAGNSEDYIILGIEPFSSYFNLQKKMSHTWTLSKLNEEQVGQIELFPHSIELLVGGENLALCHFANDCRIDFCERSTWSYQQTLSYGGHGYSQFDYTNSNAQLKEIEVMIRRYGKDHPFVKGYLSAKDSPLFAGKRIDFFDAIIQGHVHWKMYEESDSTKFYTIRAVGMAYGKDPVDTASYVVLHEKERGFDYQEVLVRYDREKMTHSILASDNPDKTIHKFTSM